MQTQIGKTTPNILNTPKYRIKIIKNTPQEEKSEITEIQTTQSIQELYKEKYNEIFSFKDNTRGLFTYKTKPKGNIDYKLDTIDIPKNIGYYMLRIDLEAPCECGCTINIKDTQLEELLCPVCGLVHQQQYCTY